MANSATNNTNRLVSQEDLDSLAQLDKQFALVNSTMGKSLTIAHQFTTELSKASIPFKELQQVIDRYEKAQKQVNQAIEESKKIHQDIEKTQQRVVESTTKQVKAVQDETKAYQDNNNAVKSNANTLRDLSIKAYNEASESIENQRKNLILLKAELKSIQNEQKQLDKYYGQSGQTNEKYIAQKLRLNQAEEAQRISIKSLGDTIKYNQQIISTSIGSYDNLSAQYSRLKPIVNQMSEAETYNGYTKQQLVEQLRILREEMSNYQKQTGVNTLDVGKYDIAVKDLTKTLSILDPRIGMLLTKVQQISPLKNAWVKTNNALATSLNISAKAATILQLAIVGLVVGGIVLAVKAYQEWKEEQNEMNNLILEMRNNAASSMGSVIATIESLSRQWDALGDNLKDKEQFVNDNQSAFEQLGVSIKTVDEAENLIVRNKDAFIEAMTQKALATAAMELASQEYKKALEAQIIAEDEQTKLRNQSTLKNFLFGPSGEDVQSLVLYNKANEDNIRHTQQAENLISKQVDALAEYDKLLKESSISTGKQAEAISPLIKAQQDLLKQARELPQNTEEEIAVRNQKIKVIQDEIDRLNNLGLASKKEINEAKKVQKDALKLSQDRAKAEAKAAQELAQIQIKAEADAQKKILENNKKSYEERMAAANEFEERQAESLIQARDYQMAELRKSYKDISDVQFRQQAANQIATIEAKLQAELTKLSDEGGKLRETIYKDYLDKQISALSDAQRERIGEIDENEQAALAKLSERFAQGEIRQTDYEKKKLNVAREYAKQRLELEITSIKDMLDVSGLSDKQREDLTKKLLEAEVKYNKWANDQKIKDDDDAAKKRLEIEKQLSDKRKELIQEVGDLIMTLFSAETERNLAKLDEQSEQNDEWREKELERIESQQEQGVIAEEQAEAQKKMITDQAKRREKELESQRKQILERQAKFEKAAAIANIGISTAQAIMRLWVNPGFPAATALTAVVAALGAVQIANVIAKPIPKYKEGTDYHSGGLAIVGDGGRAELGQLPSGEMFKTPSVSTLTYLPEGTRIYPDYEKALHSTQLIKPQDNQAPIIITDNSKQLQKLDEQTKVMQTVAIGQKKILRQTKVSIKINNANDKLGRL